MILKKELKMEKRQGIYHSKYSKVTLEFIRFNIIEDIVSRKKNRNKRYRKYKYR